MTHLTSWQDSWCTLDTATCLSIAQPSTYPWDFDRLADRLPYTHFPPFAHCFHVQALLSYLSQSSSVPGPSSMRLEGSTTIDRATSVRKQQRWPNAAPSVISAAPVTARGTIINPRRACAARVAVVVLCVSVCLTILGLQATRRLMSDTNIFSATRARKIN